MWSTYVPLATWSTAVQSAYTGAARHDYYDPWDDDEVPSEQPWHRQLRRDNDGSGEYDEQSGYDPSEYDDNESFNMEFASKAYT